VHTYSSIKVILLHRMADVKDILNISIEKTPSKVESILVGKKKTPASQKRKKPGINL
jgi:hypothetical protein